MVYDRWRYMMRIQNPDDNRFIYRLRIKFMKREAENCTGGNWTGRPSGSVHMTQKQSEELPDGGQGGRGDGAGVEFGCSCWPARVLGQKTRSSFCLCLLNGTWGLWDAGWKERHRNSGGWGSRTSSAASKLCDLGQEFESLIASIFLLCKRGFIRRTNIAGHRVEPDNAKMGTVRLPYLLQVRHRKRLQQRPVPCNEIHSQASTVSWHPQPLWV